MRINKKLERINIFLLKLCRINNKIVIYYDVILLICFLRYEIFCVFVLEVVEIEIDGVFDVKFLFLVVVSKVV